MHSTDRLTAGAFAHARRSVLLGYPSYDEISSDAVETFELVGIGLSDPDRLARLTPDRPMVAAEERAWSALDFLHVQYTAGVAVEQLASFFPEVVDYWVSYAHFHTAFHDSPASAGRRVPHIDLHDVEFWKGCRLTCLALLLGHADLLPRIAALWDYENDEMDGLLERLVAPFVPDRAPPPDTCTRHLPYFKLLKVFSANASQRPALMAKYMDEWYTASRREPYYESHTKGRDHSFLGYWSFEAAAAAYVLDIDDASFRDHEFYPKDLADFARSLPRPAAIAGGSSADAATAEPLHCPAGLPCPRAGFWFSPARPDSRRRFEAGETMPDLGGDYGATIWQWDDRQ